MKNDFRAIGPGFYVLDGDDGCNTDTPLEVRAVALLGWMHNTESDNWEPFSTLGYTALPWEIIPEGNYNLFVYALNIWGDVPHQGVDAESLKETIHILGLNEYKTLELLHKKGVPIVENTDV